MSVSSGEQSTTKVIITGPCRLTGVGVCTDGTNLGKVVIDDSTDGNGTVKWEQGCAGTSLTGGRNFTDPLEFENGIYVTVSGANATYFIETASP